MVSTDTRSLLKARVVRARTASSNARAELLKAEQQAYTPTAADHMRFRAYQQHTAENKERLLLEALQAICAAQPSCGSCAVVSQCGWCSAQSACVHVSTSSCQTQLSVVSMLVITANQHGAA